MYHAYIYTSGHPAPAFSEGFTMSNAPILSTLFRATLSAVDTANNGMGAAVVESIRVGFAEYLTGEDFRLAYKAGVSADTWLTVTNYMAPIKLAWSNGKIKEFCTIAETQSLKAALNAFRAGTGKKGAPSKIETTTLEPVIVAAPSVLSQADQIIAEMFKVDELESLKADNASLSAQVASLTAELIAAYAELAIVKASKGKKQAIAA